MINHLNCHTCNTVQCGQLLVAEFAAHVRMRVLNRKAAFCSTRQNLAENEATNANHDANYLRHQKTS
jgi:hypothetical protein